MTTTDQRPAEFVWIVEPARRGLPARHVAEIPTLVDSPWRYAVTVGRTLIGWGWSVYRLDWLARLADWRMVDVGYAPTWRQARVAAEVVATADGALIAHLPGGRSGR